jgi:hypothetical protein
MGDLSLLDGQRYTAPGVATTMAGGLGNVQLTAPDTWSSWVQLTAATDHPAGWVTVFVMSNSVARWLVDIAVGSAGNEQVIIPSLHWGLNAGGAPYTYSFPLSIPAGSRISARARYNPGTGNKQIWVGVHLGGPTLLAGPLTSVTAYGPETTTNGLVSVDCGATANTKSGWVEITAATARASRWAVIGMGGDIANYAANDRYAVDIGIGAAGSETVIVPDLPFAATGVIEGPAPRTVGFPLSIPAGVRVAVQAQCTTTTTPDRVFDIGLWLAS